MRQLALDLKLDDFALFETFYPGANAALVQALQSAASNPQQAVHWLWGAPGSGRSHLLQATVAAAGAAGFRCAWLPLRAAAELDPQMLEGMGMLDLLCIDDIDAVAGDEVWERALFRVSDDLKLGAGRLLVSASVAPAGAALQLPDLASRLAAGPTWKLRSMDDADLICALQRRSAWRGFELHDDAGRYLLRRVPRSPAALFALLDQIDGAALAAKRRITVPFLKIVLDANLTA
jgi:DnaA family protein